MRRKFKAETTAIEAKARKKTAIIKKKARLKWELIKNKSKTYIVAGNATAIATTIAIVKALPAPRGITTEDNDIIGEVPPEGINISLCFTGLFQEEIVKIFHNKFKVINFYRLNYI